MRKLMTMTSEQYDKLMELLTEIKEKAANEFYFKKQTPQTRGGCGMIFLMGVSLSGGIAAWNVGPLGILGDLVWGVPAMYGSFKLFRSAFPWAEKRLEKKEKGPSDAERFADFRKISKQIDRLFQADQTSTLSAGRKKTSIQSKSQPLSKQQKKELLQLWKQVSRDLKRSAGLYDFEMGQPLSDKQMQKLTLKGLEQRGLLKDKTDKEKNKIVANAIKIKREDELLQTIKVAKERDTQNTYKHSYLREWQETRIANKREKYISIINVVEEELERFRQTAKDGKAALTELQESISTNLKNAYGLYDRDIARKAIEGTFHKIREDHFPENDKNKRFRQVFKIVLKEYKQYRQVIKASNVIKKDVRLQAIRAKREKDSSIMKSHALFWREAKLTKAWEENTQLIGILQDEMGR